MLRQDPVLARLCTVVLFCLLFTGPLLMSGCGGAPVDAVYPQKGAIQESFTEPARTRLKKTYPITMPVSGRIERINKEPNDKVKKGQTLARYDLVPFNRAVDEAQAAVAELEARLVVQDDNRLEQTALVEAKSAIDASTEALKASEEQVVAERARWERANKQFKRMKALLSGNAIAQTKLDDVQLLAETALIELKKQQFYLAAMKAVTFAVNLGPLYVKRYLGRKELERAIIEHQRSQAKARLALARHNLELAAIRSPINGVVLEKYEQGDSPLPAGKPLLLLGNLKDLEVVAEALTQDALRISPGTAVSLEPATGLKPIPARVKRIDPAGFTKLSSLGVEQQRVKVIVSLDGPTRGLGVGYRVQARFFTGSKSDALKVSRFSVMQGPDGSFYVFKIQDNRLKKQTVKIGLRSDLNLEVLEGLTDKDLIVARPDTTMEPGTKVTPNK